MLFIQARPKYLRCIGIACFYLASKTVEEDEVRMFPVYTLHTFTCIIELKNIASRIGNT